MKIEVLQKQVDEVDEFKLSLEKTTPTTPIDKFQIDLLKAQIKMQQNYIKKLTNLLNSTKASHK